MPGLVIHGEAAAEKRISTVGSNLQLPCSPPDGEGKPSKLSTCTLNRFQPNSEEPVTIRLQFG